MSPPAIFGDAAILSWRLAAFTRPRQRAPSSGPPTPAKAHRSARWPQDAEGWCREQGPEVKW